MAAGLVSYKLCDRDFDCHRCPLDAALRGGMALGPPVSLEPDDSRRHLGFPADRRYGAGHTWMGAGPHPGETVVRVGLDGFAASLLPRPRAVTCANAPRTLARGDVICEIELPEGTLPVRTPIAGRLERDNPLLRQQPDLLVESPYQDGWLVEIAPAVGAEVDAVSLDAAQAIDRSQMHLRHFRRRIALRLLADVASAGPTMPDGGTPLISLSEILGAPQYLRLLREVLQ
jgi:glycine cleavage system H protein